MRWIEKHARHYQDHAADGRSLLPVTILLANAVAIWLFAYLITSVGSSRQQSSSHISPHPRFCAGIRTRCGSPNATSAFATRYRFTSTCEVLCTPTTGASLR